MNGDSFSIRKFTDFAAVHAHRGAVLGDSASETDSSPATLFPQVKPAELVDMFQLIEFEVPAKVEDEVFFTGSRDMYGVIEGLDSIDM
jgi:hypothetical protein